MPDSGYLYTDEIRTTKQCLAGLHCCSIVFACSGSPLITGCTNPLGIHYYNQGVEKYKADNYQGSIDDYTKAIEINPQDADAFYNRGIAKYALKDYQGAIDDYTTVIGIDPEYTTSYLNRGVAKDALNNYQGAISDFTKAQDINSRLLMLIIIVALPNIPSRLSRCSP